MSEEINEREVQDQENVEQEESKSIDFETYEKTKNDMHKFKRQFIEAKERLSTYESKLKELEENDLKNSKNYKELWEKEREQKMKVEDTLKDFTANIIEDKKISRIKDVAAKKGFDPDFFDILSSFDTSDVLVETKDNGELEVVGAETWVDSLKADRPKMFTKVINPNINNKTSDSEIKDKIYYAKDILKLKTTDPKKYEDIIKNKRHLIRRT